MGSPLARNSPTARSNALLERESFGSQDCLAAVRELDAIVFEDPPGISLQGLLESHLGIHPCLHHPLNIQGEIDGLSQSAFLCLYGHNPPPVVFCEN